MIRAPTSVMQMDLDDPEGVALGRAVARTSSEFLLRSLTLITESMGMGMLPAIILLSIMQANVAHLDRSADEPRYRGLGDLPPQELRRPVSVAAIADGLGLPYETARRHIEKLILAGWCVRMPHGVIVPSQNLTGEGHTTATLANVASVRRFLRELHAIGFLRAPAPGGPTTSPLIPE